MSYMKASFNFLKYKVLSTLCIHRYMACPQYMYCNKTENGPRFVIR